MANFNNKFAILLTNLVGSMWCAYGFGILALVSLPAALSSGSLIVIISWIAQTFLQLVLLSVIMVGQNIQSEETNRRLEELLQTIISNQTKEETEVEEILVKEKSSL